MEEVEFSKRIRKASAPRDYKVTGSLGVYDAYKWYRKNKPKESKYILKESQYFSIIRKTNLLLRDRLLSGYDILFPHKMGRLEVRKSNVVFYKKDGKLKCSRTIDWLSTIKLWSEDPEAHAQKFIVRYVSDEVYKVVYNKNLANYPNKTMYQFSPNRELKIKLKEAIKTTKFDAFMSNNN